MLYEGYNLCGGEQILFRLIDGMSHDASRNIVLL